MTRASAPRAQIALQIYTTLNVVLFTAGVYAVMMSPALNEHAGYWLTGIVAVSLVVTAPVAWALSARLRRDWRKKIVAVPSPLASAPSRPI